MDLSQLRYFVAVADAESISRAAARLRIAQPAISRQIRNLEIELGRALFVRSERGVSLTSLGSEYLFSVKAILRQLDDANEMMRSSTAPSAVLHLGIVQLAQWYPVATEIVTDFRARYPNVRLEALQMPSSAQVDALATGQIDIAIGVPFFELPPGIEHIPLFSVTRGTVMSIRHPLAHKANLSTRDIQDFPLITTARSTWTGHIGQFFAASRAEGFVPDFAETFDNFSLLLSRLRDDHSIAIMPQPGPDAPMNDLVFRLIPSIDLEMPVAVYWRRKSPSQLVEAFAQLVRDKLERPAIETT